MTTDTVKSIDLPSLEALVPKRLFPEPIKQTAADFKRVAEQTQVAMREKHPTNKRHRCWDKGYVRLVITELEKQHAKSVERAKAHAHVVLHFRRVGPTMVGDWNDRLAAVDATKRYLIKEAREKFKDDPEHTCHNDAYVPAVHIKERMALVSEVLKETLGRVDGITVAGESLDLAKTDQLDTMVQILLQQGIAPDAFLLALAAQIPSVKDFLQ